MDSSGSSSKVPPKDQTPEGYASFSKFERDVKRFNTLISEDPKRVVETLRIMHIEGDISRIALLNSLGPFIIEDMGQPNSSPLPLRVLFQTGLLDLLMDLLTDEINNKWKNREVRRIIYRYIG